MTKSYFITGTGTDIGKTFVTCALIKRLLSENARVAAIKPIISGVADGNLNDSDAALILLSQNLSITPQNINNTSPWRLQAPLSPDIAAAKECKNIDFAEVVNFCKDSAENCDYLLIEGAGGVMTPINSNKTMVDLIAALQIPAILVTGTYLGAISHTLTAIKTLESYGIEVKYLVVNQSKDCAGAEDIIESLQNFTDLPIVFMPYGAELKKELNDFAL